MGGFRRRTPGELGELGDLRRWLKPEQVHALGNERQLGGYRLNLADGEWIGLREDAMLSGRRLAPVRA